MPRPISTNITSSPLAFHISNDSFEMLKKFKSQSGLNNFSQVIAIALENFDFKAYQPESLDVHQCSVRLPFDLKKQLIDTARQKKVSIAELIRASVEAVLSKDPQSITQTEKTKTMAKKAVKKAAKKAAPKTAKKATVKKVAPKKAAVKKAVAKKAAVKKTAAKKVVAKTAKKAVKKAAVKKVAAKTVAKKAAKKAK